MVAGVVAFPGQAEQHVVAPVAVDLQVVLGIALFPKSVLFKDAARGDVVGQEGRVDAVQTESVEDEGQRRCPTASVISPCPAYSAPIQ